MKLMGAAELNRLHAVSSADECFRLAGNGAKSKGSALLPEEAASQMILAKEISELLLENGVCLLEMTYWHNDLESNQNLFYGYRRGCGDERSLSEAAVYEFGAEDHAVMTSILSMTFYFRWAARVSDARKTYLLSFFHDGFVDYDAYSKAVIEAFDKILKPYQKVSPE